MVRLVCLLGDVSVRGLFFAHVALRGPFLVVALPTDVWLIQLGLGLPIAQGHEGEVEGRGHGGDKQQVRVWRATRGGSALACSAKGCCLPEAGWHRRLAGPMLVVVQRVMSSVGVVGGLIQDDVHMLDLALPK